MTTATVRIVLVDNADGCTYERTYVNSPDFSESVRDLVNLVLPFTYPDFANCRIDRVGHARGQLRDVDGGIRGSFDVTEVNA